MERGEVGVRNIAIVIQKSNLKFQKHRINMFKPENTILLLPFVLENLVREVIFDRRRTFIIIGRAHL